MGLETRMPPLAMNVRRPEGRPAAGIITVEKVITGFHALGANTLFLCVSPEQKKTVSVPVMDDHGFLFINREKKFFFRDQSPVFGCL